mmetsp:Transcript_45440/g.128223  ORF Transcript_45440/g.128223 Transcript_45440/m.128223 type:complete len:230 (+) Transcript_45440:1176-1865(+)
MSAWRNLRPTRSIHSGDRCPFAVAVSDSRDVFLSTARAMAASPSASMPHRYSFNVCRWQDGDERKAASRWAPSDARWFSLSSSMVSRLCCAACSASSSTPTLPSTKAFWARLSSSSVQASPMATHSANGRSIVLSSRLADTLSSLTVPLPASVVTKCLHSSIPPLPSFAIFLSAPRLQLWSRMLWMDGGRWAATSEDRQATAVGRLRAGDSENSKTFSGRDDRSACVSA